MGFQGFNIEFNEGRVVTPFVARKGVQGFNLNKVESSTTFFALKNGFSGFSLEPVFIPRAIVRFRR